MLIAGWLGSACGQEVVPRYQTNVLGTTIVLAGNAAIPGATNQWCKDGVVLQDNSRITGSQTSTLTISGTLFTDAGTYMWLASRSDNGTTVFQTNSVFIVEVLAQPTSLTNLIGSTFVLQGNPTVPYATNQWFKDGILLEDDSQITGSQTPTLTISNAFLTNTGTYTWVATLSTNGTTTVETNSIFIVYVITQPTIQNFFTSTRGADVVFEADATGGLLSYQWFWQGQSLAGATNSALDFPNGYATASAGFYSLLITNPVGQVSSPLPGLLLTKPTPSGIYQGLFFNADTNSITLDSSGFFQYTLSASKRSFSGKIVLMRKVFPFSGAFSAAHDSQVSVPHTPLQLSLQLVATNNTAQVFGSLSSDTWTSALQGNLLFYSSRNPFPRSGRFTLSLQDTNTISPARPNGAGFGIVRIVNSGAVAMSGLAADATPIAQSCGLSKTGDWPLYVPLYKGRGLLLGWLQVTNQSTSSIQSNTNSVFWIKTSGPDKYYPDGFFVTLQAEGSTYNNLAAGGRLLSFSQGVAAFGGGDLFSQDLVTWDLVRVTQPRTNVFMAEQSFEKLTLSLNRANGTVSGRFVDLTTGLGAPIRAIVLQQQNIAPGFFLSTNSSGFFILEPSQ